MLFGNQSRRQNETCTTAFLTKLVHAEHIRLLQWNFSGRNTGFPGYFLVCKLDIFVLGLLFVTWLLAVEPEATKRFSPMKTPGEKAAQTVWLASTMVKEFLQFHVLVLRNSLAQNMPQKRAKEQHYLFPPQIFIAPQWHARRGLSMPAFLFLLLVVCYGLMIKSLHFSYLYPSYI